MDLMSDIVDDLRFYAEMEMTPIMIELAPAAYAEVLKQSMALLRPGNPPCFTLFGIPVTAIQSSNSWARCYRFNDTNPSVCEV